MARVLKQILNYLSVCVVFPLFVFSWIGLKAGSERLYLAAAESLAGIPGPGGVFLRRAFYHLALDACSLDVVFEYGTFFPHPRAEVGPGVAVGAYGVLGCCRIGAETHIASNVSILSGRRQHGLEDRDQGRFEQIVIGSRCWIGERSVVMADLGDGCTVGAGAVVVRPVAAGVVAAGNPARPISGEA